MSKSFYIFLLLIFSQILHSNSGGPRRGGRARPSNTRGGGSRGVGSSVVGESSAGSSSSVNETQNQIPLVKEVLKDIADIRNYLDCLRLINYITEHPEDYHNIKQNKKFLEELLTKKGESKKQIKVIMNKMVSDEATRAEIKKYCNEEGEKIRSEIPEKFNNARNIIVLNEAVRKGQKACPVCLADYKEDDVIEMTQCNHFYHQKCIVNWFNEGQGNYNKCPSCRADLVSILHPDVIMLTEKLEAIGFQANWTLHARDD